MKTQFPFPNIFRNDSVPLSRANRVPVLVLLIACLFACSPDLGRGLLARPSNLPSPGNAGKAFPNMPRPVDAVAAEDGGLKAHFVNSGNADLKGDLNVVKVTDSGAQAEVQFRESNSTNTAGVAVASVISESPNINQTAIKNGLSNASNATTNSNQPVCWQGNFTETRCCRNFDGLGDPDCFDGRRYTYDICCLGKVYVPPEKPKNFSDQWRLVVEKEELGGWLVHGLEFHITKNCSGGYMSPIRHRKRILESGHKKLFFASYAFGRVASREEFWYSSRKEEEEVEEEDLKGAEKEEKTKRNRNLHYLGLELIRPAFVQCFRIWHGNIPGLPLRLERKGDDKKWVTVKHFDEVRGGRWATYSVHHDGEILKGEDGAGDVFAGGLKREEL